MIVTINEAIQELLKEPNQNKLVKIIWVDNDKQERNKCDDQRRKVDS